MEAQAVKMKGFECGCISYHLVVQAEMDFHGQLDNAIQASSLLIVLERISIQFWLLSSP